MGWGGEMVLRGRDGGGGGVRLGGGWWVVGGLDEWGNLG